MNTKIKRGIYKKSASYFILYALEKAVDGFIRIEDMYRHGHNYGYGTYLPKSQLAKAIKRLREKSLIVEDKTDANKVVLKLTELGKDLISLETFDETKWDGKWRVVIWDIPEQKRIVRNMFRRNLKKWGFKHLQRSVWVSKMDIYDKLTGYIKDIGIEKWVIVLEVDKFSNPIS